MQEYVRGLKSLNIFKNEGDIFRIKTEGNNWYTRLQVSYYSSWNAEE